MNEFGIKNEIFSEIINVFKKIKEIEEVVLFGSRARGNYKKTSDIDLAVKFTDNSKKQLLIRSLDEIRCILKFDVLDIERITNENLLLNIENEGKVIYKRK